MSSDPDFEHYLQSRTLNGLVRGWFERLPHDSINEWADLREAFAARFSVRRACFKEPHKITKIVRKANESLTTFKERWTVKTGFIMGVSEIMRISSFMDSVKSSELAKRFSNKVPTTMNEMMERLDDFVQSEEATPVLNSLIGKQESPIAKYLFRPIEGTFGLVRGNREDMTIETGTGKEIHIARTS
nr:reverse transcriptase domain-containing protein [Tanacetum cinerariifolium]